MARPARAEFTPKNPQKYNGKLPIITRSGWEWQVCMYLDAHPYCVGWSSESVSIPYVNPLTGRNSLYVPDFLVAFMDRSGRTWVEMWEIKPAKENPLIEGVRASRRDKLTQAINLAKWQAAAIWCSKQKIIFRILTERELFGNKVK